ncbi:hypothetical protein CEXT_61441 [Caerostris extrusa]|uniref:Uncharacterized protein n=1 Tax=Caerostris extrusa TaxID=172846 RepID=A0AAV4MIL9_CAEEX|nr:hypothetical protein CEXT_61441 [Caerostris extrusa]
MNNPLMSVLISKLDFVEIPSSLRLPKSICFNFPPIKIAFPLSNPMLAFLVNHRRVSASHPPSDFPNAVHFAPVAAGSFTLNEPQSVGECFATKEEGPQKETQRMSALPSL